MKAMEKNLKALANQRRLTILKYLKKKGTANVGELAAHLRLSFKSTSRHLSILFSKNIVDKNQIGLEVFYSLSGNLDTEVKRILELL